MPKLTKREFAALVSKNAKLQTKDLEAMLEILAEELAARHANNRKPAVEAEAKNA